LTRTFTHACTHILICRPHPFINHPGDIVTVTLVNALDAEDAATQSTKTLNSFRHPSRTNLHTHGLHIDPADDNVMLDVGPVRSAMEL
jgi:FtsP/CotA-like multicopper oxidase with cupredoxin domain